MAKSHAEFMERFTPEQREKINQRADLIVLGQRLRMIREQLQFTQAQIAAKMGLEQAAIARLEKQDDYKLSTLKQWAQANGGELVVGLRRNGKTEKLVG